MSIGNKIKQLRINKSLSQGELAEVLHVTAQAVSKWESNVTSPDISQLPAIASFFGITIDELFEYPVDLEYERIENLISNGKTLTNDLFAHCEEFLINEMKREPQNYRAHSILGDLYHFHACRLNEKAIHYAYEALQLQTDNKFDLNTLNNASNGHVSDWNIGCHYKLIDRLKKLVSESVQNERTKLYLIDNLIADYRLEEAIAIISDMKHELLPFYQLRIKEAQIGFDSVREEYGELCNTYSDNWKILMEVANRYAFHRKYEEAVTIYERTFEVAPKPRYTDMLACISFLHRSLGNKEQAIEACKRELVLLKEEWDITKGELVDEIKERIKGLRDN